MWQLQPQLYLLLQNTLKQAWRVFYRKSLAYFGCGEGGIRTPGTREGTPDFESGTFDHSVTSPMLQR